jgi:hypothetical protein
MDKWRAGLLKPRSVTPGPMIEQSTHQWLEFQVDPLTNSPVILFHYPTTQTSGFDYLKRSVKLEFGSLTEQRPVGQHPIKPWIAEESQAYFRIGIARWLRWRLHERFGRRPRFCMPNIIDLQTANT